MGYGVKDKKGKKLCNFYPRVEKVIKIYNNEDVCVNKIIKVQIMVDNNDDVRRIEVELSNIDQVKWRKLDERCQFDPEFTDAKIQRYLADEIRSQLDGAPQERVYELIDLGLSFVEGEAVFCTGKEVITPPSSGLPQIVINQQQNMQGLDIDTTLLEEHALSEIFDLISLSPNSGRIILMYKLIYLMRQAYIDAGAKPNFCIYLYGKTGTMKTTFSSFLTQLYNRGKGIVSPPRLNASIAAVTKILSEVSDDTIVLDDLCPAESNRIRKEQEETLIEITRYVGDGTMPLKVIGKGIVNDTPKCGVIFTGEYIIGKGSDAARLLPIEMTPPDGGKLKHFQDNPLIVSTFYYYFIRWFVAHYQEVIILLKEWLGYYRRKEFGIHARLQEMHFFLCTACVVFMWYCHDNEVLSSIDVAQVYTSFCSFLMKLVQEQDRRVRQGGSEIPNDSNCLERIRVLYKTGQMQIASDAKTFDTEVHDGLLHRNGLYLRGERVSAYFPGAEIKDIADSLEAQGALETGKSSRTKQISSLKGMRFYVIPSYLL